MLEHFWYILSGAVFVTINIILWVYRQHCKAKGVTPPAPFETLKKHERRISQWSDILIGIIIFPQLCGKIPLPWFQRPAAKGIDQ